MKAITEDTNIAEQQNVGHLFYFILKISRIKWYLMNALHQILQFMANIRIIQKPYPCVKTIGRLRNRKTFYLCHDCRNHNRTRLCEKRILKVKNNGRRILFGKIAKLQKSSKTEKYSVKKPVN
jgi:hypothetical protein